MDVSRITIRQDDHTYTTIYPGYSELSQPMGSILILHDMAEHHGRYREFTEYLNEKGYDVFIYDMRGHGRDVKFEELGHIADDEGYSLLIQDAITIIAYIKKVNRGKKVILFGQGMGALVAQNVIQTYDEVDACICSGTSTFQRSRLNKDLFVADLVKTFKKPRHISPYLSKRMFGFPDFAKISNRTSFDWLTRDNQLVGTYMNDPLCGFTCSAAFYCDLIQLAIQVGNRSAIKNIRKDLPILFISGSDDPIGGYGNDIADLFDIYQRLRFTSVDCVLYDECRHELLHEQNKDEIMRDIAEWLNKALNNRNLAQVQSLTSRSKAEKAAEKAAKKKGKKAAAVSEAEYVSNSAALAGDEEDDDFNDLGYFERAPKDSNKN